MRRWGSSGALSSGNKGRSGSDPTAADAHHPIINGGRWSSRAGPSPCGMDSLGYIAPRRMRCHGDDGEMAPRWILGDTTDRFSQVRSQKVALSGSCILPLTCHLHAQHFTTTTNLNINITNVLKKSNHHDNRPPIHVLSSGLHTTTAGFRIASFWRTHGKLRRVYLVHGDGSARGVDSEIVYLTAGSASDGGGNAAANDIDAAMKN